VFIPATAGCAFLKPDHDPRRMPQSPVLFLIKTPLWPSSGLSENTLLESDNWKEQNELGKHVQ